MFGNILKPCREFMLVHVDEQFITLRLHAGILLYEHFRDRNEVFIFVISGEVLWNRKEIRLFWFQRGPIFSVHLFNAKP